MRKASVGFELLNNDFFKAYDSEERIKKILESAMSGNIIVLEGELTPEEYNLLIQFVMASISKDFYGVELEKVHVRKGLLKRKTYTIVKPRLNGCAVYLEEKIHGFNIIAKVN